MIAEAAYFLAEKRGFLAGHDQEDWFTAERLLADGFGNADGPGGGSAAAGDSP